MISGRLEVRLKLVDMPKHVQKVKNDWRELIVRASGLDYVLRIRPRAWQQIQTANNQYEAWMAIITGKLGARVKNGFRLTDISVQVVERNTQTNSFLPENASKST